MDLNCLVSTIKDYGIRKVLNIMKNPPHDPQKVLNERGRDWDIFQYAYQFTMLDKIYVSILQDKSIPQKCIQLNGPAYNYVLAGDIQKEFKIDNKQVVDQVRQELTHHLSRVINQPVSNVDLNEDLWVNYQQANEFNPAHSHAGIFSFVIYADIPEEIREEEKEAHGNMNTRGLIQFSAQFTNDRLTFNPSTYTIFIFESSHVHQVYPFYSDNTRITIAGNIHGWS